jgi:hypothetical protein
MNMALWTTLLYVSLYVISNSFIAANGFSKPFTNDFPRADIHELISPDILHQVIKGTFKDHLVTWVEDYLVITHGKKRAKEILDDIDRRYVLALTSIQSNFSSLIQIGLPSQHLLWVYGDSLMVGALSSGQAMIQKLL